MLPRGEVVGLDCAPEMIAFAQRHHGTAVNLRFDLGDARALPYQNEFDVVFSSACLHWVVDHGPVVAGIARALRPGGRCTLAMGGRGNAQQMVDVLEDFISREPWAASFREFVFPYGFHTPADYARWCANAGLTLQRAELVPRDMVHSTPTDLAAWFRTTWLPYIQRLPENLRERFVAAVVERAVASMGLDPAGRLHLRMVRLEVQGFKPSDTPLAVH